MEPRYRANYILFVNPKLNAVVGEDAIVQMMHAPKSEEKIDGLILSVKSCG